MKNRAAIIIAIVFLSLTALALAAFLVFFLEGGNFNFFRGKYRVSNTLVLDNYYELNFEKLNIDADASDIYVYDTEEERVRVVIYGDEDLTSVKNDNRELNIRSESKKCIGFCFNFESAKIEIYLPKVYSKKITIVNKYGDVEVENFELAEIEIEEKCGNIDVKKAKELVIDNDYGDTSIGEVRVAKVMESAGNVSIGIASHAEIKNKYGNIEIDKIDEYANIEDNCGDIRIKELLITQNSHIQNDLGNIEIGNTGNIYIEAKTHLGDTKIRNNYRDSEVTLNIENNCGDIRVEN